MDKGEKVALLAIGVNIFLFLIKYLLAGLSGSIALKAEAFHSLADVVASLTVFSGLKLSKRKSKSFPYGLYKVENLVSIIVALAIFYADYEIVMEAIKGSQMQLQGVWWAILGMLLAVGVTYGFSKYEAKVAKEINSPSLMADSEHIRVDMLASAIVLIGLFSSLLGYNVDRIAAFIIAGFIAWSGGEILIDAIRVLLDASLDYETLSQAEKIISAEPQVVAVNNLVGRNSGRYRFIEASIVFKTQDLGKAHFTASLIEKKIREEIKNVDQILIHYEPMVKEILLYAVPLENKEKQIISDHFGEAPCFSLISVKAKSQEVIDQKIISNPFIQVEKGKGILVAEMLNKYFIDVLLVKESFTGKGPSYVFSDAAVEVILTKENTLPKALDCLGINR